MSDRVTQCRCHGSHKCNSYPVVSLQFINSSCRSCSCEYQYSYASITNFRKPPLEIWNSHKTISLICSLSRRVPLVEQELLTVPEHLSSPLLMRYMLLDLQFYVYVLQNIVCLFVLFLLTIVLSVLLRFTDSDYPFGIFKLLLKLFFKESNIYRYFLCQEYNHIIYRSQLCCRSADNFRTYLYKEFLYCDY